MTANMNAKFDKYWGNLEKQNKLLYVTVVLDPHYKLDYLQFCFQRIYEEDIVKSMITSIRFHLLKLIEFYTNYVPKEKDKGTNSGRESRKAPVRMEDDDDDDIFQREYDLERFVDACD